KFPRPFLSVARFAACDLGLQSNMSIGPERFRRGLRTNARRPLRVFEVSILVRRQEVPAEMPEMTPGLQNHSTLKRLAFCRDHQAIVLSICARVRFTPMQ